MSRFRAIKNIVLTRRLLLLPAAALFCTPWIYSEGKQSKASTSSVSKDGVGSPSTFRKDASISLNTFDNDASGSTNPLTSLSATSTTKTTDSPTSNSNSTNVYTRAQVADHKSLETQIWVSYLNGVYDITDFIKIHPGGDKLLLAAGSAIDPFWAVFSIHNTSETRQLLENYRIGSLMPIELDATAKDHQHATGLDTLFENEPVRDASLLVRSARPCNAEAPADALLATRITPSHLFFVRNHLPVPKIEDDFELQLEGPGIPDGFSISLVKLKEFPKTTCEVTLQCAGNRRNEMHAKKAVKGLLWQGGAISNTTFSGARLTDVLENAGYPAPNLAENNYHDVMHVCFDGAEGYGASIPVEKALDPRGDVILAYEMNGEPIPADHGFPLRAVVPGHVAARSVKWLNKITLSDTESEAHWQQHDYKGFSPSKTLETSDYSQSESIQEPPVQSAILYPSPGAVVKADDGLVTVKGYALAGGGRGINRVDVSVDGGRNWTDATLSRPQQARDRHWAWTQWEAKCAVGDSPELELVCKAVDTSYNPQPDGFEGIYNARGVLVNAWQHIKVTVEK